MQTALDESDEASSRTQSCPQKSILLVELALRVEARPLAVTVYEHPPWKEQRSPLVLAETDTLFVSVIEDVW